MRSFKPFTWAFLVPLFLTLFACGKRLPVTYKSPLVGKTRVCKVAILPFSNESGYPMGGVLLYRVFLAEMVTKRGYQVVGEGDVRKVIIQQRSMPGQTPDYEFYKVLVESLGVDAVVTGRVIQMEEVRKGREIEPKVAFWLEVRDARNGKVIWNTYNRKRGGDYRKLMHFGVISTVTALARRMCDEVLRDWEREGLEGCEK